MRWHYFSDDKLANWSLLCLRESFNCIFKNCKAWFKNY